jgi:hypothetical protein
MTPRVELLWWAGCPSRQRAIELLRDELARAGLDPERLVVREIRDEAEAARERFPGSPTILVDGRDIQAPRDRAAGLTCRVYRLRDGRISALPDPADVAAALTAAIEGGDGRDDRV